MNAHHGIEYASPRAHFASWRLQNLTPVGHLEAPAEAARKLFRRSGNSERAPVTGRSERRVEFEPRSHSSGSLLIAGFHTATHTPTRCILPISGSEAGAERTK
jgi:hypothetical protein